MFIFKNQYYLYIENSKLLNLNFIKKRNKFVIIYRNAENIEKVEDLKKFRKTCKQKAIKFYVANNLNLSVILKADGIYLSAFNKKIIKQKYKNYNLRIIGSAHNIKEICEKKNQGCEEIILSRLFKTDYSNKKTFLGITKFNLISSIFKENLIPLGGIRVKNLRKLLTISSDSFAIFSEIKKKPANIINRLF